ncbi:acyl-CoA dehydrogenase family protein [Methylobacterium sp. DCY52]|jgi:alkylation response protein AidB-like acyl-CoA dehydrogenase|uniref:acyl-CoA dehydrogenase family protein n=1 Tax=Methylobacterium sp. DCY52 TaxID=739139 RepID=UPI00135528B1|nr:hypothetical protein [Methylobacterium sp. 2A]
MDQRTPPDLSRDAEAAARAVSLSAAHRAGAQDRDGGFPSADIADLARLGLLAAPVPVALGGAGLGEEPGAGTLAEVLRLIGSGSLALGRLLGATLFALVLLRGAWGSPISRAARCIRAAWVAPRWRLRKDGVPARMTGRT